jgi:CheY-like chemotaxis protein
MSYVPNGAVISERHDARCEGAVQMERPPRHDIAGQEESTEGPSPAAVGHTPDRPQPIRGKAILVVDDEPDLAEVLVELFTQDHYRVDIAANGEEALEKLQQRSYDAIICDILMPRLNGPAFYHTIARRQPELLWRVLFVTGDILSQETQEFLRQTAAPVLEKPFSLAELRRIVRHILRARERR